MSKHTSAVGAHQTAHAALNQRFGFLRRRLGKLIALSQYGLPFSIGPYPTFVARFRALARRSRFVSQGPWFYRPACIAMALGWPIGAFFTALKTHASMREREQRPNGLRVLFDMYWIALRHSIPPLEYALYRFNRAEHRKDMHQYVFWNDLPGLAALNGRLGADNRAVQDKAHFANICADHGFPHVPTLAVFDGGLQIFPVERFAPNAPKLWVKSLRVKGDARSVKWLTDDDGYYTACNRRIRSDKLADEFRKQDCLAQPFIENHPDVARLSNGALASLRIVTGMNPNGDAEFVTTLMALPYGVCDTSVAGILCSVESKTGHIRKAVFPTDKPVTQHPDTGASIIGMRLPFWHESLDLVCRAHRAAFPRFAFLGWDIALTKVGPILLEANSGWGAIFHQMLDGPIGYTAFSRLVSHYV